MCQKVYNLQTLERIIIIIIQGERDYEIYHKYNTKPSQKEHILLKQRVREGEILQPNTIQQ